MKITELLAKLNEVKMDPTSVRTRALAVPDAQVGIEFELIVRDFGELSDFESEPDYDNDSYVEDSTWDALSEDIMDFFRGDHNTRRDVNRSLSDAQSDYGDWRDGAWDDFINDNYADWHEKEHSGEEYDEDDKPYLDDFKDEFWNDFVENQGSIESWLEEEGLRHMSDWESRYDLMWPNWTEPDDEEIVGTGNRGFEDIASSFGKAVGMNVEYDKDDNDVTSEDSYVIVRDSSLKPKKDSDDYGLEFKSPPLPVADVIDQLQRVKNWAKVEGNAYTNQSTGLHMNVSVPGYSIDNLDYIKLALFLGDDWVSEQFDRQGSSYAESSIKIINDKVRDQPEVLPVALEKMKSGLNSIASKLVHSGYTKKFTSINTKENRVEFRAPGNDWLSMDLNTVVNAMLRMVVALDIAMDPKKEAQEYSKKLYKVLSPKIRSDAIELFTQFQQGKINTTELKRQWAENVLGLNDLDTKKKAEPRVGSKAVAQKIMKPYMKNFNIVRLGDNTVVHTIEALDYNKALRQAFDIVEKLGIDDDNWSLQDAAKDTNAAWYVMKNPNGITISHAWGETPEKAYQYFDNFAKRHDIAKWRMEPER